jgi:hypothetical protein
MSKAFTKSPGFRRQIIRERLMGDILVGLPDAAALDFKKCCELVDLRSECSGLPAAVVLQALVDFYLSTVTADEVRRLAVRDALARAYPHVLTVPAAPLVEYVPPSRRPSALPRKGVSVADVFPSASCRLGSDRTPICGDQVD